MAVLCIAGQTFTLHVSLTDAATAGKWKSTPVIALGDFQRSINGAGFANLTNLPTVTPAASKSVEIILAAAETTAAGAGGLIYIVGSDPDSTWDDVAIEVRVHAATGDVAVTGDEMDLITDAVDANSLATDAADEIADHVWDEALAGHLGAGSTGEALDDIEGCTCGGGANAFTYTVTDSGTGLPIDGVHVWITTDAAGLNVIWNGYTDAFGVARTSSGSLPMLDAGNYYFWKQLAGFTDDQAAGDLEAVP